MYEMTFFSCIFDNRELIDINDKIIKDKEAFIFAISEVDEMEHMINLLWYNL